MFVVVDILSMVAVIVRRAIDPHSWHSGLMKGVSLKFGKPVKKLKLTNTNIELTSLAKNCTYVKKIESSQFLGLHKKFGSWHDIGRGKTLHKNLSVSVISDQ